MRNRRQRDVRNRSPPVNTRNHRPTGRYQESYPSGSTREERLPRSLQRSSPLEHESYPSHHSDSIREERQPRSLQRSSPFELERSERMLVGRRGNSVERRDYNSTLHFNGKRDGGSTRTPPSEQPWDRSQLGQGGFSHQDSTLIEQRLPKYQMLEPTDFSGHSSPSLRRAGDPKYQMLEPTDFSGHSGPSLRRAGDSKYQMLEPTDFSGHSGPSLRRAGDSKYQMLEPTDFSGHSSPSLRRAGDRDYSISRVAKDKDFHGIGSSVDGRSSALVRKPLYLDDGTLGTYFKLPMDSGSALNSAKMNGNFLPSSSSGNLRVGFHKEEELRYNDPIHTTKMPTRDSIGNLKYKDEELQYGDQLRPNNVPTRESYGEMKPVFYPRDASHPASPFSQSNAFQSISSGLAKDEFVGSYQRDLPLSSNGFSPSSGKYTGPLVHDGNSDSLYLDSARHPKNPIAYQQDPRSPLKGEYKDFSYTELERRQKPDPGYMSDGFYDKMHPTMQGDYGDRELSRPSYMDPEGKRFDDIESSHRSQRDSALRDHHSLQRDQVSNYFDKKTRSLGTEQDEKCLGARSNHLDFEMGAYSDHRITNVRADYSFEGDAAPRSYRESPSSGAISRRELDSYRLDLSPQQRLREEEIGIYDSSERLIITKYAMDDEVIRHNPSSRGSGRNISRQVELIGNGEHRRDGKRSSLPLSKRLNFGGRQKRNAGRLYDRMAHRASASDDCFSSQHLSVYEQQHAAKPRVSIKKRLRPAPSSNHNRLERRLDFHKPYKFRKPNWDDQYDFVNAHDIEPVNPVEDYVTPVKSDVPEDSEEFKNMVDRAFLQFYKQMNENPAQRRKYKEQGAAGTLLCSVCGSSKEFVDTQSLALHAAMSLKVGLRAEHFGLHKALCVLMGWNSTVSSDHAWFRQVLPDADALAVKEDLVLWPPLVIIHNISIGNKNPDERKVVTIEEMEAILLGLGFGGGKTKVCRGKPANQSIMVVKFMPTFSGLQEAERLHNYYMENKRGRKEFPQMMNSINDESREEGEVIVGQQQESMDHVLYGYIGIAEDLDKLEFETKGKCVVRSKKDIMAIADAPLRTG